MKNIQLVSFLCFCMISYSIPHVSNRMDFTVHKPANGPESKPKILDLELMTGFETENGDMNLDPSRRMSTSNCPLHKDGDKCKKDLECCSYKCVSNRCQGDEVPCGFQAKPCGEAFSECKTSKECCSNACVKIKKGGEKQGFCSGFVPDDAECSTMSPSSEPSDLPCSSVDEFQTCYAGLVWNLWRTGWKGEDGKLASQPYPRPDFDYGHTGSGRGPLANTGIGDKSLTDYEVSFDYKILPPSTEWNPYGLPSVFPEQAIYVSFRIKSSTESWNEPETKYSLTLNRDGSWGVGAMKNRAIKKSHGWGPKRSGKHEYLARGQSQLYNDVTEGRLRIRVVGSSITAWLNEDEQLFAVEHEGKVVSPILYGGFGVGFTWESMGWISNLEVKHIE